MLHRLYVALWSLFHLTNFAFGFIHNQQVTEWHAIFITLSPLSICITITVGYVIEFRRQKKVHARRDEDLDIKEEVLSRDESRQSLIDPAGYGSDNSGQRSLLDSMIVREAAVSFKNTKIKHQ